MKKVLITITMDSRFVSILNASVALDMPGAISGEYDRQMTPVQVLALVALMEARGATEMQVHAVTPPEWRPHLDVIHSERRVQVLP